MYNFLISGGIAIAAIAVIIFAAGPSSWWWAILVGLLLFGGSFLLISRIVMKKVLEVMETANRDLQAQRVEKSIRELKEAFRYGKWQMYVEGQINAQIGMIYYLKRDFSTAFPYLEKAFAKNWVAMSMLAITFMKRNKRDKMKETFEKAAQWSPKESLLWALYAYCWTECEDMGQAKAVLERGLKKLPGDEKLKANLEALQEGKKMKMKVYGDMWLQFHLERQSVVMKQQMAAMGGMKRRIVRR
jgi:tetratricopeptide (TPR) repeat protein